MKHFSRKNTFWLPVLALLLAACSPSVGVKIQQAAATSTIQPESSQPANTATPGHLISTDAPTQAVTSTAAAAENPQPVFKTSIGVFAIEAVRWVDKVNGVTAGPGERLLLVFLNRPDQPKLAPSNFSLQAFDNAMRKQANGEVHIALDDGSHAICSMAGWIEPDFKSFAMGFRIPQTVKTLQLVWPGNDPIDLLPEG